MPSNISNAVGTARQFTPQPDSTYQGRYADIRPERAFYQGSDMSLGRNMARLSNAFNSWRVAHEQKLDTVGLENAQRMINAETPADIEKLNTIDAAQTYGFVDDTANPYFRAYADKLRGNFLAAKMKQEYDNEYAMSPAKSMDDEAKRYSEYSQDWMKKRMDGAGAPQNRYAFETGFNESRLVHINSLWGDWQKKKRQEDIVVTMSSTVSKLGSITEHTPELIREGGGTISSVLEEAQEVWNTARLMGLPADLRLKLLNDWKDELVKSGHLNREQIGELMDGLIVQTHMDGTGQKASELLNMMDVTSQAAKFNAQFLTKETRDMIQSYVQREDVDGWLANIERLRQENPEEAVRLNQYTATVLSKIDRQKQVRETADRRRMEKALQQQEKTNEQMMEQGLASTAIDAWLNGGDGVNGKPIKSLGLKKENVEPVFLQNFYNLLGKGDYDGVMQLLSIPLPCSSDLKSTLKARMNANFLGVTPEAVADGRMTQEMRDTLEFCAGNANAIEAHFGGDIAKKAGVLQTLVDVYGSFDEGLKYFAVYNSTPEEKRKAYKDKVGYAVSSTVYDVEGIKKLGGGDSSLTVFDNPDVESDVTNAAVALSCCGLSPDDALNEAAGRYAEKFFDFRGTPVPVGIVDALGARGIPSPRYWLNEALEQYAGDYDTPRYDRQGRRFLFGTNAPLSLEDLYDNAEILFRAEAEKEPAKPSATNDTTFTVDELNEQRKDRMGVPDTVEEQIERLVD